MEGETLSSEETYDSKTALICDTASSENSTKHGGGQRVLEDDQNSEIEEGQTYLSLDFIVQKARTSRKNGTANALKKESNRNRVLKKKMTCKDTKTRDKEICTVTNSTKTRSRRQKSGNQKVGTKKMTGNEDVVVPKNKRGQFDICQTSKRRKNVALMLGKRQTDAEHYQDFKYRYTCYTCTRRFITETSLAEHIKWTHEYYVEKEGLVKPVVKKEVVNSENSQDLSLENSERNGLIESMDENTHYGTYGAAPHIKPTETQLVTETEPATNSEETQLVAKTVLATNSEETQLVAKTEPATFSEETQLVAKTDLVTSSEETQPVTKTDSATISEESQSTSTQEWGNVDLYDNLLPDNVCMAKDKTSTSACLFCDKLFMSKKGMLNHVALWCKKVPYRCILCKRGLFKPDENHFHLSSGKKKNYNVKQSELKKDYSCGICQEKFQYKVTLENHQKTCNKNKPHKVSNSKVQCEICEKLFSKSYLQNHMARHKDERRHVCEYCGERWNTSTQLYGHIRGAHVTDRKFKCQYCHASYTQKAALLFHQNVLVGNCKADLAGVACFKCTLCSRSFTSLRWLARHQEIHRADQSKGLFIGTDFSCQYCGKTFKGRHLLLRHVKTHTNEKPFQCDQCGAAFVQKVNLEAHMKTHTGERPHPCPHCDKSFIQKSGLKTHLKKHTSITSDGKEKVSVCKEKQNRAGSSKSKSGKRKMSEMACQTIVEKKVRKQDPTFGAIMVYKVVTKNETLTLEQLTH